MCPDDGRINHGENTYDSNDYNLSNELDLDYVSDEDMPYEEGSEESGVYEDMSYEDDHGSSWEESASNEYESSENTATYEENYSGETDESNSGGPLTGRGSIHNSTH